VSPPDRWEGIAASGIFEAIAHAVESFDPIKCAVHHPELLAEPLDMAVDCPIVDKGCRPSHAASICSHDQKAAHYTS
jgi:hypothetical protein